MNIETTILYIIFVCILIIQIYNLVGIIKSYEQKKKKCEEIEEMIINKNGKDN